MPGRQAKFIAPAALTSVLRHVSKYHSDPKRSRTIILLSAKAGLRAAEIAKLEWPMVLNAEGNGSRVSSVAKADYALDFCFRYFEISRSRWCKNGYVHYWRSIHTVCDAHAWAITLNGRRPFKRSQSSKPRVSAALILKATVQQPDRS